MVNLEIEIVLLLFCNLTEALINANDLPSSFCSPLQNAYFLIISLHVYPCFREMGGLLILITWLGISRFTDIGR